MKARRSLVTMVLLGLLGSACSPNSVITTIPPTTTTSEVPPPPATGSLSTTTTITEPETTTTVTEESGDVDAQLEEAKRLMDTPELVEGGTLAENGAFDESSPGTNPFGELEIYSFVNKEGRLIIYIEGPAELVRAFWAEFDAVDGAGAVVKDTSYLGDKVVGPPWAGTAENGTEAKVADNPPNDPAPGSRLGALIPTDITTLEEFFRVSIWLYSGLVQGNYDFSHYQLLKQTMLENSEDGLLVAAIFFGLLGFGPNSAPILWVEGL